MKKLLIVMFVLISGAGYGQVEQDSSGAWMFYGYVGEDISLAVPNDGKYLNDMIEENVGKEVKLTIFLDRQQAENFKENMIFTVYDSVGKRLPAVQYRIIPETDNYFVYDESVDMIEGWFYVESGNMMRSLVVSVVLRQVEK
jgi:hypothetical protein